MPLVTTTFLHLTYFSVCSSFPLILRNIWNQIVYIFCQTIVPNISFRPFLTRATTCQSRQIIFYKRKALIINKHIIAKHTDGDQTECIAKSPVAPIMSWTITCSSPACTRFITTILPGSISTTLKSYSGRIPHIEHPLLKRLKIVRLPTFVVTHQLGSLRKFIAIKSSRQGIITIPTNICTSTSPRIEYLNRMIGTSLVILQLPSKSILISNRCATSCIDIIFSTSTTNDGLYRISRTCRLCKFRLF